MYATIARTLLEKGEEGGVNKRWSEREGRGGEREAEVEPTQRQQVNA